MDLVFQGKAWLNKGITPDHIARARGFFEQATALDRGNVEALVGLATVDQWAGSALLTDDPLARFAAAEATCTKVLSVAPNHVTARFILSGAQMFTKRATQGIAECERVLVLDRNSALAHALIGFGKSLVGRGEETEAHISEALRISPRDTLAPRWLIWVGLAKVALNDDIEAVARLRRGLEANRNYSVAYFNLAAVLAHLGDIGEAQAAVRAGLALDPEFSIRRFRVSNAWSDNQVYLAGRERQCEGMRLAGVPEG
jgi:tetratricopeptide (TPR) repeat protein